MLANSLKYLNQYGFFKNIIFKSYSISLYVGYYITSCPGSSLYLSYQQNPARIFRNILFNLNETVAPDNQFNPYLAIVVIKQNYRVHLYDSSSCFNFVNMFSSGARRMCIPSFFAAEVNTDRAPKASIKAQMFSLTSLTLTHQYKV